jgi:hypothetical protein
MKWNTGIVNWDWDKIRDVLKTIGTDVLSVVVVAYGFHYLFYYPSIIVLIIALMSVVVRTGFDATIREWTDRWS